MKEMKQEYLASAVNTLVEEGKGEKEEYVNTAGNTIEVIPPTTPEEESNVSITIEDEEGRKKKVRRKKRPVRRTSSNEEAAKVTRLLLLKYLKVVLCILKCSLNCHMCASFSF